MHSTLVDNRSAWFYDVDLYGLDDDIFKVHSGSASVVGNKIRIKQDPVTTDTGIVSATTMVMGGLTDLRITIPTAPTAGDERVWGFYSRSRGNRDAAYFYITGTNFYARTYDEAGTVEQTTITWDSDWTNAAINWEIRPGIGMVEFLADGLVIARHSTSIPRMVLNPPYFSNNKNDSMDLAWIEVAAARKIYFAKPAHYSFTTSTSTTTTTTTTTSTSSSTTTTSSSTSSSTTTTTSTSSSTTTTSSSTSSTTTTSTSSSTTTTSSSTSSTTTTSTSSSTTTTSSSTTTTTTTTSSSTSSTTTTTTTTTTTSTSTTVTSPGDPP